MQEFNEVQKEDTHLKLSERNIIELVIYLISKNKLPNLLYTIDGKTYITKKRLEKEIIDELEYKGGRIGVNELPILLNMDISNIENAIKEIINNEENQTITLVEGKLLTE
jgi:E3 UFM1-protein ligase 1